MRCQLLRFRRSIFFFFVDTVTYSSQLILFLSTALNYTHTHTQYTSTASHLFSQPVSHRVRQLLVCQCCGACKYATHKQAQHALVRVCRCVRSCVCLENYVKRKCIKWKCKWKCADAMCACVCVSATVADEAIGKIITSIAYYVVALECHT